MQNICVLQLCQMLEVSGCPQNSKLIKIVALLQDSLTMKKGPWHTQGSWLLRQVPGNNACC